MVASMTGYGRGSSDHEGRGIWVELRSVNSRFLEVSIRLPRLISNREADVQARIRQAFDRGRVSVQIQFDDAASDEVGLHVNETAARAYRELLDQLRTSAGIDEPVQLQHLLTFSDVFTTEEQDSSLADRLWEDVQEAVDQAISDLQQMRRDEGRALEAELNARLEAIERHLEVVEARAPERVLEARNRLLKRLEEVLGDERINRDRVEMEITLYADKLDVTEETVRLRSHLNLFREALAAEESQGRKLNFLVQEMNREINTIGSKANDAAVAHQAVAMKEELEKVREQVQNVE